MSKLNGEERIADNDIGETIISCSTRSVRHARSNYIQFGNIDAPGETVSRPKKITDNMWLTVEAKNNNTAGIDQQAIANFLMTAFHIKVNRCTISREIKRRGWSG